MQNKWGFFALVLGSCMVVLRGLFWGDLFRLSGMFWLAASDLQIVVIALLFVCVEALYLSLLAAFAQVWLLPAQKSG